jgi:hypothetical protein
MESAIFFVTVLYESVLLNNTNDPYIDDVFIGSSNINDIPFTDLQEINLQILNDAQHTPSRRNPLKRIVQSPVDRETPNTQITTTGPMIVDVKKTVNVRDSGFLDDEDGLSGRDSELASLRKTPSRPSNSKQNETVFEEVTTPNDLISRKLKSKKQIFHFQNIFRISSSTETFKPNSTVNIEQQRERERQRLREEDERRRKLSIRKDHPQPISKFEPLVLDLNNDEESHSNKVKTPTSGKTPFFPSDFL